ncbi:MAG: VanZ family protein [Lachnospiraceae bacterium]|nr:VanZ family protein [Lachnospiraceae bacterium]
MITGYIVSALKYAIVFCVIYIIVKKIYLRHNGKKFVLKSEILYIIFGAYIVALLSQTIIPICNIFFVDGKFLIEVSTYNARGLNIIPFKTILNYLTGANDFYGDANMTIRIVNLLGNICLFVPFGFLFPMVFDKFSKVQITLSFGILLSVFIEIMQFFIERSSDIDDTILNCIGVFLGYMCYKILSALSIKHKIK